MPHLRYLRYVLLHKWYVFRACRWLGVPLWRALIHDWSKLTPAEWGPYVRRFYGGRGGVLDKTADPQEFKDAWRHHWERNPHHWEYWLGVHTRHIPPGQAAYPMPDTYVREMVADWYGAGMAQGKPDIQGWYEANKDRMLLAPETRCQAERLLATLPPLQRGDPGA